MRTKTNVAETLDLPLPGSPLRVAGLFAGIGGLERGLHRAGHRTELLCEIDPSANRVLRAQFGVDPVEDVRDLRELPDVDLIAAGFPCQDLSQAGMTAGIRGAKSGLVTEVFRLLKKAQPRWLLLENVSFMLSLDAGAAMTFLTDRLKKHSYSWAYRIVDSRAFGLPQRRQRVLLLASQTEDPRDVLLSGDRGPVDEPRDVAEANGFYWTEGIRGLGWASNAVPTLKGGSTVGIPSPPAIWVPSTREIGVPDIRDAERLQGFPSDWTLPAVQDSKKKNNPRWKLVGNAVSVPVAEWVGKSLREPGCYDSSRDREHIRGERWPRAAWCLGGKTYVSSASEWPVREPLPKLLDFLNHPLTPLSARATAGFYSRTKKSTLRFPEGFLDAIEAHLKRLSAETVLG